MTGPRLTLLGATLLAAAATLPALAQPAGAPGSGPGPAGRMTAAFDQADADHDGRVTWPEAWAYIQSRFNAADTDHDGALTEQEWQAAGGPGRPGRERRPPGPDQSQRRAAMFRSIDSSRDGRVTLDEVRPTAEAWFRALDANGDNAVTREELPPFRARPAGR